jgi:hypothetical protein
MSYSLANRTNLKSNEIINNTKKDQAVLNFNAGFFGGASEKAMREPPKNVDGFAKMLEE